MKLSEATEKYKTSSDFFTLKNDRDKAEVRFLYDFAAMPLNDIEISDLDCYVVHEIELDGKRRVRQCTMDSSCPDCQNGNKAKLRMFIQLFNTVTRKVEVWERPASYASRLLEKVNTYGPLINRPYLVTRLGAKGSTDTKYEIDALDKDNKTLSDFPDRVDIVGTVILRPGEEGKSADRSREATPRAAFGNRTAESGGNFF